MLAPLLVVGPLSAVTACELLVHDVSLDADSGTDTGVADVPSSPDGAEAGEGAPPPVDAGACGTTLPDGAVRQGPAMVEITSPRGRYCIDTTEVTVAQFNAYLLQSGAMIDTPDGCAGTMPIPVVDNAPQDQMLPVTNIGECTAWSYCRWANKRLCGTIADGGVALGTPAVENEWAYACVNAVANTAYPYGIDYDPSACNTEGEGGAVPVGSKPRCHGTTPPFDQIYDMSGNAEEYVNDIGGGDLSNARPRGGSWLDGTGATCDRYENGGGFWALGAVATAGFRCCADAVP